MILVRWASAEHRGSENLNIVLDKDTVQQHRHSGRLLKLLLIIEDRSFEKYLVSLPLTRSFGRICQRDMLLVDTSRHPIGIGRIVPVIQHLQLIAILRKHAAVAASLGISLIHFLRVAFSVEMDIFEAVTCSDRSGSRFDGHGTILEDPLYVCTVCRFPMFKRCTVKENRGIGGRVLKDVHGLPLFGLRLPHFSEFRILILALRSWTVHA